MISRWAIVMVFVFIWAKIADGSNEPLESTYCLSWKLNVELNNIQNWKAVPEECVKYIEHYMLEGQYEKDVATAIDHAILYAKEFRPVGDGMDVWILDVDDTSLSNLEYYKGRKFGGELFDPISFNIWALSGQCPALSPTLELYKQLIASGFKVFFISGRHESQRIITEENLISKGYTDWAGLILRGEAERGESAVAFKSRRRGELTRDGYRIWGNGGDQWSDITGDAVGARTFKIPNPMYFIS
eukprot:Gb_01129 [translate_table: standard]